MKAEWLLEICTEGSRNLLRHKMRSSLTLMGVVIGVGAVIAIMGIGEGAQRTVLTEIAGLGLNNVIVDSVQPSVANVAQSSARRRTILKYGLTWKDVDRVRGAFPDAGISVGHLVKQKVFFGSKRLDAGVLGVKPDYFDLFRTEILDGVGLAALHNREGHRVAVITEPVVTAMPAVGGPVGRMLKIGAHSFEVIGVVRVPSSKGGGMIYVPFNAARRLYGITTVKGDAGSMEFSQVELGQLVVRLSDEAMVPAAAEVIDRTLGEYHKNADTALTVPLDLLASKQRTQRILNLVLLVIAGISLLVGGIGIMNIMLAIVAERIPEVGIRRAVGASRRDILLQFLIETVVLSTAGGILGCLAGFAAVPLASMWTGWPGVVTPGAVVVSLVVAWGVGVAFGIAPAYRASRLDPVECLRYE